MARINRVHARTLAAISVGISILAAEPTTHAEPSGDAHAVAPPKRLFSIDRPDCQWVDLHAQGFDSPVTGVIYRKATAPTNGMALGGIDTGCIDLETSGLWGYCTIFNTHVPRRGPMNLPFLGVQLDGKVWVLCDPTQIKQGQGNFQPPFSNQFVGHTKYLKQQGEPIAEPYTEELKFDGLKTPAEIHYWGHYPVADMEYEMDAPVSVGLRAWSPFIPGSLAESMIPGIVFEVQLRNSSDSVQKGSLVFSFPGPTTLESGGAVTERNAVDGDMSGVRVATPNAEYVLAAVGVEKVRTGGALGADAEAWGAMGEQLPAETDAGASVCVEFDLKAGDSKVVRFLLTWNAPNWKGGGKPWAVTGNTFTHMYAKHYPSAVRTAEVLANQHEELLRRILAWQAVVFEDPDVPGWLGDSMINSLYMITETGLWAQATGPLSQFREEDGLFGMNECPRTCPQIECIPCGFYGNLPLVYFYPELALSTLRGYKQYMFPDGAAPWIWGGWTAETPPIEFAAPDKGYQWTTNGISMAAMFDRYLLCHEQERSAFVEEFYPALKANMVYTANLRTSPEYSMGQRLLMMPDGDHGHEWFEAGNPAWFGMTTHAGALHLAQLRIARRIAELAGDQTFVEQCDQWLEQGMQALERDLWADTYYLNCFDPLTGKRDDLVFGFQLDGQWVTRFHGLPGVFQTDRVGQTLETIRRCNASISQYGVVNYANRDGSAAPVGGYGPYSWFPPEVLMLSMTYMYEGHREYGLELARRAWENIICRQRYTWDMPNIMRGDNDTGERGPMNGGHDYYQDMMIWSLPAALKGQDLAGPVEPDGLVSRIIAAGRGR
jgi:uncharacterized protein (DUF608 family)